MIGQASLEAIELEIKRNGLVSKMNEAVQAKDIDTMKDAISKAREAGVESSDIARCEATSLPP